MTPLISISDLMYDSWNFFKKDWKTIVKRNAWSIPVMIVYLAFYITGIFSGRMWIVLLGLVLLEIGSILVRVYAMRYILIQDSSAGQATKDKTLVQLFWPALLISIISGLSILGGSLLFILPGIWIRIASSFALFAYLEEGTTGINALGGSMELVKGRWWKTLWRFLVPNLVFQIIIGLISLAIFIVPIVIAAISGAAVATSFSEGGSGGISGASIPLLIIAGILFIVALLVNFFLSLAGTGLMQIVQTKLFHSLKASR